MFGIYTIKRNDRNYHSSSQLTKCFSTKTPIYFLSQTVNSVFDRLNKLKYES